MAVKREDDRYNSDPLDEISGIVEHVERSQQEKADGETPAFRMKVTGDARGEPEQRRDQA